MGKQNPVPGLFMPRPYSAPLAAAGGAQNAPGTQSPPPTDQQGQNNQALQVWAKTISPRMYGVGTPILGSNPPPAPCDSYLLQRGRALVSFTSGSGSLTLPLAFPNGWLSLMLGGLYVCTYTTAGATLQVITVETGGIGTGTAEVDFDAVGW